MRVTAERVARVALHLGRKVGLDEDGLCDVQTLAWHSWVQSGERFSASAHARWALRKVRAGRGLGRAAESTERTNRQWRRVTRAGAIRVTAGRGDDPAEIAAARELLAALLASLDARERAFLSVALHWHGATHAELAEALGATRAHVRHWRSEVEGQWAFLNSAE